jgi:PKD repeat protein
MGSIASWLAVPFALILLVSCANNVPVDKENAANLDESASGNAPPEFEIEQDSQNSSGMEGITGAADANDISDVSSAETENTDKTAETASASSSANVLPAVAKPEGKPILTLTAEPLSGKLPMKVRFTARLGNIADNEKGFYCVPYKFDFGGTKEEVTPSCGLFSDESTIQKEFTATHTYTISGIYDAKFSVAGMTSNIVRIEVIDVDTLVMDR